MDRQVKQLNAKRGNYYKKHECIKCGKIIVGGTTLKLCDDCRADFREVKGREKAKARSAMEKLNKEKKCLFCEKTENLNIHHIDRDNTNHSESNMVYLCSRCHVKLHGKVYNPLLRRVFRLLVDDRHTYQDIALFFGTTKQNVYGILNKKVSTDEGLTKVN